MVERKSYMEFPVTRMIAKVAVATTEKSDRTQFIGTIPQAINWFVEKQTPTRVTSQNDALWREA